MTPAEQALFDAGRADAFREAADMADQTTPRMTPPDERTDEKKWADIWHVGELAKALRAKSTNLPGCTTLVSERFATPQDFDVAEFVVATSLGLFPSGVESWFKHKGVFWSNTPLGNALGDVLMALVRGGVLEKVDDKFVWVWDPDRKDVNCPRCSYNGFDPTGYAMQDPDCTDECPMCHGTRRVAVTTP